MPLSDSDKQSHPMCHPGFIKVNKALVWDPVPPLSGSSWTHHHSLLKATVRLARVAAWDKWLQGCETYCWRTKMAHLNLWRHMEPSGLCSPTLPPAVPGFSCLIFACCAPCFSCHSVDLTAPSRVYDCLIWALRDSFAGVNNSLSKSSNCC